MGVGAGPASATIPRVLSRCARGVFLRRETLDARALVETSGGAGVFDVVLIETRELSAVLGPTRGDAVSDFDAVGGVRVTSLPLPHDTTKASVSASGTWIDTFIPPHGVHQAHGIASHDLPHPRTGRAGKRGTHPFDSGCRGQRS